MTKNPDVYHPNVAIPDNPNGFDYSKAHIIGNLYGIETKFEKDSYLNNSLIEGEVHFERMYSNSNTLYMKNIRVIKDVYFNELQVFKLRIDDSEFSNIEMNSIVGKLFHARRIKAKNISGNKFINGSIDFKNSNIRKLHLTNSRILISFCSEYKKVEM